MQRRFRSTCAALLCIAAAPAEAAEPPSASHLRADCRAYAADIESPGAQRCLAYIQGFLDGTTIANARIVQGVSDDLAVDESFSQRARRTRVRERSEKDPAWYTGVCIADSVPIGHVVTSVIEELNAAPSSEGETAATAAYRALLSRFPCRQPVS